MGKPSRSGFPQMNKDMAGAKGGSGIGNPEILDEIFPTGNPDNFDVAVNMSPQDGDVNGVSSGPVDVFSSNDADDRDPPQSGNAQPGGGW